MRGSELPSSAHDRLGPVAGACFVTSEPLAEHPVGAMTAVPAYPESAELRGRPVGRLSRPHPSSIALRHEVSTQAAHGKLVSRGSRV